VASDQPIYVFPDESIQMEEETPVALVSNPFEVKEVALLTSP